MHLKRFTCLLATTAALVSGCSRYSSREEIAAFARAGTTHRVDHNRLVPLSPQGPYRVNTGDLLQIELTNVIQPLNDNPGGNVYRVRVDGAGTITLPLIGSLHVADKPLPQLSEEIAAAYHPRFVLSKPTVNVTVLEFEGAAVTISGAVVNPGVYQLRRDQMTVLSAIREAGGVAQNGASAIRLYRAGENQNRRMTVLTVDGPGASFADIAVGPGDVIEVERQPGRYFTVRGLVARPGVFAYPPGEQYNLSQALGFAGDLVRYAPRRAEIYRRDKDGITTTVAVSTEPDVADDIIINPSDVIIVEPSFGYHVNTFLADFFRVGFFAGANYDLAN